MKKVQMGHMTFYVDKNDDFIGEGEDGIIEMKTTVADAIMRVEELYALLRYAAIK